MELATSLDPGSLHRRLQDLESEAGRKREVRWGERTLDLDLLLFGRTILDTPSLTIPHPRMAVRRFVLAPLAEIAPGAFEPITGRTARDLLANLDRRPSRVVISPSIGEITPRVVDALAGGDEWIVSEASPRGNEDVTFLVLGPAEAPSPGSRPHTEGQGGLDREAIIREILAACEASRGASRRVEP